MGEVRDINALAKELYHARATEATAKDKRIEIEEELALLVETSENGSKTVDAGDGLKVVVKRALTYKANVDAIADVCPEVLSTTVKITLNAKAYENLRDVSPSLFSSVSEYVETKPRKVAVTLKLG